MINGGKWGAGGLLEQASAARTRRNNAEAAVLERGLRDPGPKSIIGGELVDGGDTAGYSRANALRNAYNTDYQARVKAQAPPTFDPAKMNTPATTLRSGTPAPAATPVGKPPLASAGNPATGPAVSANPAIDAYEKMMQGGAAPDVTLSGGANPIVINKAAADFGVGQPSAKVPLQSAANRLPSTDLSAEFGAPDPTSSEFGMRNGGMIGKQRTVTQPGYKNGGKVKMPTPTPTPTPEPQWRTGPTKGGTTVHKRMPVRPNGLRGYGSGGMVEKAAKLFGGRAAQLDQAEQQALGVQSTPVPAPAPQQMTTYRPPADAVAARQAQIDAQQAADRAAIAAMGKKGYQKGGPVTDNWQYLENVDGEMREVPAPQPKERADKFVPNPKNSLMTETFRQLRHKPEPTPTPEKGMRGYKSGGCVTPKNKVNRPGYANGGEIMLPPEAPGAIGDVEMDTGEDTQQVAVRPGEYLLNPETVAFFGQGDYESGLRALDQIVQQATGEEPGPEMVETPESGEMLPGFTQGGFVDDFGNLLDPRQWAPSQQQYAVTPQGQAALTGNTRGTTQAVMQSQAEIARAAEAARHAEALRTGPPLPRGMAWERAATEWGTKMRPTIEKTVGKLKSGAKSLAGPALGGVVEVARQVGDKQKNQFYADPAIATDVKALQLGSDVVDSTLRYGGGVFGGSLGAAAGLGTPGSVVLGTAGAVGGYMGGDALWEGDNQALRDYRAANPVGVPPAAQQNGAPAPNPYGRAFQDGRDLTGLREPTALYAANRPVPGNDARVVQRTGGPGEEVIIREDINGVPTFTNLRRGGFDGSAANLQKEADRRAADDVGIRAMQAQAVEQMRRNAPIYTQEGVDQRRAEDDAMAQAELEAASRGTAAKPLDLNKELEQRFQQDILDEDGQVINRIPDQSSIEVFNAALAQLDPVFIQQYGAPFSGLPLELRNKVYDEYGPILRETVMANRAAKQQGIPTSEILRTGDNGLRVIPGSDIGIGDVWGPEATIGDYTAGMLDGDSTDDRMVVDPRTKARIPLRQLLAQNPGAEQESLRRYGMDALK